MPPFLISPVLACLRKLFKFDALIPPVVARLIGDVDRFTGETGLDLVVMKGLLMSALKLDFMGELLKMLLVLDGVW